MATLRPELVAYAHSLSLDRAEAEDLVHDAIARALQRPPVLRGGLGLRAWMFRVIRNLLIDQRRKERVRREYFAAHKRSSDAESTLMDGRQAGDVVETMIVRQAFVGLARRDREILCLIDILGLTYAEAAEMLGIPVGTVMSRISRARRAMLAQLGESNVRPLHRRKA